MGMSRIFWDTNLFIYLIEGSGRQCEMVASLVERMNERGDQLYTSVLTLGEVLVKPIEKRSADLRKAYEELLAANCVLIAFDKNAARHYAEVRQDRTIRPPDAIQLSCAGSSGIDLFITNDDRLSRKVIDGIQFITSLENAMP
jgi:predicted nucleic acid-binding protein